MGYFNPITYFIKSFIRLFTRKFFWVLLILILVFVGFILYDKGVFAVSDTSNTFVQGFPSTKTNDIINVINNYREDYDSVFGTYHIEGNNAYIWFFFYNYDVTGRLYATRLTGSDANFNNYTVYSEFSSDNSVKLVSVRYDNLTYTGGYVGTNVYISVRNIGSLNATITEQALVYNRSIYSDSSFSNVLLSGSNNSIKDISPYFDITNEELQSFDFDYFKINGGTSPYYTELANGVGGSPTFRLQYIYNGVTTDIDVTDYVSVTNDNHWTINIPYNVLTSSVIVRNDKEFVYNFYYEPYYGTSYALTTGTLKYNIADPSIINEDTQRQLEENQLKATQETTQATKELQNSITDTNVDDITSDTLPSDNTTDITADGVNGIFNSIYNAFCTGEAQDIVFPIPFTEKNITLSPTYVSDMLSNNGAGFIITLIQAFWWYLISRFIIKDVMSKINKIKSGNIEKIETTNIRGDML